MRETYRYCLQKVGEANGRAKLHLEGGVEIILKKDRVDLGVARRAIGETVKLTVTKFPPRQYREVRKITYCGQVIYPVN